MSEHRTCLASTFDGLTNFDNWQWDRFIGSCLKKVNHDVSQQLTSGLLILLSDPDTFATDFLVSILLNIK